MVGWVKGWMGGWWMDGEWMDGGWMDGWAKIQSAILQSQKGLILET